MDGNWNKWWLIPVLLLLMAAQWVADVWNKIRGKT